MRSFKIDGTKVTYPTSFTYGYENLHSENSGRSQLTGIMIMDLIRKGVRNYTLNWQFVSEAETSKIMKLMESKKFIKITIADGYNGEDTTLEFYTGGHQASTVRFCSDKIFYSLSINIVQK